MCTRDIQLSGANVFDALYDVTKAEEFLRNMLCIYVRGSALSFINRV